MGIGRIADNEDEGMERYGETQMGRAGLEIIHFRRQETGLQDTMANEWTWDFIETTSKSDNPSISLTPLADMPLSDSERPNAQSLSVLPTRS